VSAVTDQDRAHALETLWAMAARLGVRVVRCAPGCFPRPRPASPGLYSLWTRMGSLRHPGVVWYTEGGEGASAVEPAVLYLHEVAHALMGICEERASAFEDMLARTMTWPASMMRELYRYQRGVAPYCQMDRSWFRRGWLKPDGTLSDAFFRHVRKVQEVAMLKKPFTLSGSVPRDYSEALFWERMEANPFTPPPVAPKSSGVHGWGLVPEGASWIWYQGAPYALFAVRIDVVRVSQAWVKAQLELRKAAFCEENAVERVPRVVLMDLREALTEEAARRATPEPKLFYVLVRFDQAEPDAEGQVPVTLWCDRPPAALEAQFRRALMTLGIKVGNERGIGDSEEIAEGALPEVEFERKLVDRIRHAEVVAGDASFVLGDEVKFNTPSGSVSIKGHAENVLDQCLGDETHRLSLITLTVRFGEDLITLKYDFPTYSLKGLSLPNAVVPDYGEGSEHAVARIELLESLTRDFREAVRTL